MQDAAFWTQIVEIMALPPEERHQRLAALHTEIVGAYTAAVWAITPEQAAQPIERDGETRTLAQVVGHITEWERFLIMGASDVLAGLTHPRMVTSIAGYKEPDGRDVEFAGIDAFNAYQAEKHAGADWAPLQAQAIDTATVLHALFTDPRLLTAARLEATKPSRKRLQDGTKIPMTMGWNLWLTTLEHEGVEHAAELGME